MGVRKYNVGMGNDEKRERKRERRRTSVMA
jgi:hypothetical protein